MKVTPLENQSAIKSAFQRLQRDLSAGAKRCQQKIGFRGGNADVHLHWRAADGFWLHFDPSKLENRYWCCYGVQDPTKEDNLDIAVEINPPKKGFDRRIAGAFVAEPGGRTFLAHSGKIGGGKKGVGKEAFGNFYLGPTSATVSWPDGEETETILIAELGDRRLPQQVGAFVQEVARFKMAVSAGSIVQAPLKPSFSPEFEGTKTFKVNHVVESSCDHGLVVRALKKELESHGVAGANDRARDLFTLRSNGEMDILFEVKTALESTDLYSGVGQLMIHGARESKPPKRVLVIPKGLNKERKRVLSRLGITVLDYHWRSKAPIFPSLKSAIV